MPLGNDSFQEESSALRHRWQVDAHDETTCDTPTCCEFGGANLDVLYVTTASLGRAPAELVNQPLAGGLFALDVGVRGLPATPFRVMTMRRRSFLRSLGAAPAVALIQPVAANPLAAQPGCDSEALPMSGISGITA